MLAVAHGTIGSTNVRDTINMMATGRRFVYYTQTKPLDGTASSVASTGDIHKTVVNLFYSKSNNALYWCAPSERTMNESNCIKLSALRKVLLGKQTPTLRHPALAEIPNTKCVAVVDSKGTELNVSAETPEILSAWLFGLQTLAQTKSGKNGQHNNNNQHQPSQIT